MTNKQLPTSGPSGGFAVHNIQRSSVLFDWLFKGLDASEPQLLIPRNIRRDIDKFRSGVLRDGYYDCIVLSSGDILDELFPSPQSVTTARCGFKLLKFIGGFSDAQAEGCAKVPRVHIAKMMIATGGTEFKGLEVRADGKGIESDSKFEEKFGVSVNVPIPKRHRYEDVWDLGDMAQIQNRSGWLLR